MRRLALCLILVAACGTRPNPAACCIDDAQCAAFGIDDGPRECQTGLFCDTTGTCVESQCDTSTDCMTSPNGPVCIGHLCTEKCTVDDDCNGIAGAPFCGDNGECVACKTSGQCTDLSAPVCDSSSHSCRTCGADDECAGGICLEAEGTCVADQDVRFVTQNGADNGNCTRSAPCGTISSALGLGSAGQRTIVHILGGSLNTADDVTVSGPAYVDGATTEIKATAFTITNGGDLTIGNITLDEVGSNAAFDVQSGGNLRIARAVLSGFTAKAVSSGVIVEDSAFSDAKIVDCANGGTFTLTRSAADDSNIVSKNCQTTITRNKFTGSGVQVLAIQGGQATFTNNLFVEADQFYDVGGFNSLASNSLFAFNTVVNTGGMDNRQVALDCDLSFPIVNNIFAYHSSNPLESVPLPACNSRFNLFDTFGEPDASDQDIVADPATFFVNTDAMDFHPATGSPAIGAGDPTVTIDVDFDGTPRPTSRPPDIGAFTTP